MIHPTLFFLVFVLTSAGAAESEPVLQADQAQEGVRLLRRAQDAMGGAEILSAVADTTHVMDVTLEAAAGGYSFNQTSRYVTPNDVRQEQETPFGRIVVYSDSETGWIATPEGSTPLSDDLLTTVQGVLFRQPTALMMSDRDPSRSVQSIGGNGVVVLSAEGQRVEIEFNSDSGLPSQHSYLGSSIIGSADDGRVTRTETLADWRAVDGVWLPFKMVQFENGTKVLEIHVSEWTVNTGLTIPELSSP